ncbi:MAG: hypothetical protein HYX74_08890 [Acidobacteria bacterium]|nr:hypothetical protein [Acidobacteriota bacterium]
MKRHSLGFCLLGLASLSISSAAAAVVSGNIQVRGRSASTAPVAVVYAEPSGGRPSPRAAGSYSMAQRKKTFIPRVLVIPAGSTVHFPNEDLIFHNVFSLSQPGPFDLGLYRARASKSRGFAKPGTYHIFCNIHPDMAAVILVVPTSYIVQTGPRGNYQINLPPGRYRLTAWSERSQPASREIEVTSAGGRIADLTLDEAGFTEQPHKNKFGQDYPKGRYDPLRGRVE